jgi:hypothetical protein
MDIDTFLILSAFPLASLLFGMGLGAILCIRKGSNTNVFLSLTLIFINSIFHLFFFPFPISIPYPDKLVWSSCFLWIVGCLITRVRRYKYILYTSQILAALLTINYLGLFIWWSGNDYFAYEILQYQYKVQYQYIEFGKGAVPPSFAIGFAVSAAIFARKNKSH